MATLMLPRLVDRMGVRRAVIVGAVTSALWHTPFALSGIHHLEGFPIALTAVIMPFGIGGAGLIIGWLLRRTESIWMVALAHGALNNWKQRSFKYVQDPALANSALVLGAGNLALVVLGRFLPARSSYRARSAQAVRRNPCAMCSRRPLETRALTHEKRYDSIGNAPAEIVRVGLRSRCRGTFNWSVWTKPLAFAVAALVLLSAAPRRVLRKNDSTLLVRETPCRN